MNVLQDYLLWIIGFIILTALCIVIMLLRNRAAKTDSVGRSEADTVRSSVALDPERDTKKLD